MTNPAVEAMTDGPSLASTDDADASFLADFDSKVNGNGSLSDGDERSSSPEPDAAAPVPAAASDAPAPDQPSDPVAPADADDAIVQSPLAYTVNGQNKTVDWAVQVGDRGVAIPQEHIGKLQDLIQRDEWQGQQNRELYAKSKEFDALTHTVGENEYRGVEAFRQLQASHAQLDASGGKVIAALADPEFVTNLALAYQSGDQRQVQQVLAGVIQQIQFVGEKAQFESLRHVSQQQQQTAQQQASVQTQDMEYRQIVSDFGRALPDLTRDDLAAMADHFAAFRGHIFRPATLAEAQQLGVRAGAIIKDPTVMYQWANDRAQLRKGYTAATSAAQTAARENAARLQAPPKVAAKKGARPTTAKPAAKDARFDGDDGTYAAWKKRLEVGKWAHDDSLQDA